MGRVKELLLDNEDIVDDSVYEGLYYQSTIWNVVDIIQRYGMSTVLGDIVDEMKKKEIK